MLQNASRAANSASNDDVIAIFTEGSAAEEKDDRVARLSQMLTSMTQQMSRLEEENRKLRERNGELEGEHERQTRAAEKAASEVT